MEHLFGPLAAAVKSHKADTAAGEAVVFAAWKRVAGEGLYDRALPIAFADKHLTIAVENEQWLRQMKDLARQVLPRLNQILGGSVVKRIEFEIDAAKIAEEKSAFRTGTIPPPLDLSVLTPSLLEAANTITDPNLRQKFLHAAARGIAKN